MVKLDNMKNFQSRGDGGGKRGFLRKYKATCAKCGQECEVPFRPSGGKPVYCSNCFQQVGDRERPMQRSYQSHRPGSDNNRQMEMVIQKLDKIIALLTPARDETVE